MVPSMSAIAASNYLPWTGRDGRFSPLRAAVFALALAPACWMAWKWNMDLLSPKPVTDILREAGDWAMRFIVMALAITPLRNAARWNKIIAVRRMIGLFAAFYLLIHLTFYFVDQQFILWRIALEIIRRLYLTIGFAAFLIFMLMAVTSNDAMVKRLGAARWNRIHSFIYLAALLSIVHYFMQVRLKAYEPSLIAGLLVLLAGYRLLRKYRGELTFASAVAMASAGGLASALIEAGYYTYSMNVPFMRVFETNLDFSALEYSWEIRPAWYVLAAGLCFALIIAARTYGPKLIPPGLFSLRKTETARHR